MFDYFLDMGAMVSTWIHQYGLEILLVLLGAWLVNHFLRLIVTSLVRGIVPHGAFKIPSEERKREDTLIETIYGFLIIFLWVGVFFYLLDRLGVPVVPLLTGAGILGIAIGFGSQSLIKDVLNGMFIIIENQFRIGDVITVGSVTGTVEGMTLRVTKLRQLNGTVHYVPNGEIKVVSNESKDFSVVDLTLHVGKETDIDFLSEVITKVGKEFAKDKAFKKYVIEAPYFLRIDDFTDHSIGARILCKVYPKHQYKIAGELRKRFKQAFEENNVNLFPIPTSIIQTTAKK